MERNSTYLRVKSKPMPLFHSTFSMFSTSLGRKQVTIFGDRLIRLSRKSNTNFEENAKCS